MTTKTVSIPNLSCGHCVMTIKRKLGALAGVERVDGDVPSKQVTITWDAPATWEQIVATLNEINYPPA